MGGGIHSRGGGGGGGWCGMCSAQFYVRVEQTRLVWDHTPLHNMSTLDFSTFIYYCKRNQNVKTGEAWERG